MQCQLQLSNAIGGKPSAVEEKPPRQRRKPEKKACEDGFKRCKMRLHVVFIE